MAELLQDALATLRPLLLDPALLVRAVAAGRQRAAVPSVRRAELRPVDLRSGRVLQVVTNDGRQSTTRNVAYDVAAATVDALLAEPFGNWHVETVDATVQLRVTKKGAAQVHRTVADRSDVAARPHDRVRQHLLAPDDPLFSVLGADGDKRRQVDAFLRVLEPIRKRLPADRLRVVDLGCGNAYLTFAAHRFLTAEVERMRTVGVDVRPDMVRRNAALAEQLGMGAGGSDSSGSTLGFEAATIEAAHPFPADQPPHLVLALHACDTATDEALARAVRWGAPVVLAAPCCHHDIQRQITQGPGAPAPYAAVVRHPILRERYADVLTDTLRSLVLRMVGYTVDVVEFVGSQHTPRNVLIRAVRTGTPPKDSLLAEYRALTADWGVHPALARLLDVEVTRALAG